ncbi:DEAD/DEAH box helicase [Actinocrinis puniceicyclus]|uniref:DEAD/DEAH box helicase n=1 Tax=Actinocrinis puniceicyclus TaxID=977794 RepID=A0A8J8BEX2_9ACTN|nr:DEAD/DEAH box helicase [Actinocrinis puniceicyclus]MBS2966833.1 DEAD/DEAH box helicase [Actinocrinis puniceicyclus]
MPTDTAAAIAPATAQAEAPASPAIALPAAWQTLLDRLTAAEAADAAVSALVDDAVEVWRRPGFDTLLSLDRLAFEPFDYQRQTATIVLRRMRGRAVLADEVGLGKTIEAGLILSELRMRGLADRTLVITPAGLVEQWREELERKFALPTADTAAFTAQGLGSDLPIVVASLAAARRDPLRSLLTAEPWDAVVGDEAHRLRNPRSASGKLARQLTSRYLLLLTATPVENKLDDLHELLSLAAPGLLGTAAQFRAAHGSGDAASVRDAAGLRAKTREVMVRHRRSEVALRLPPRIAETVLVTPGNEEARFYADLAGKIRAVTHGEDAGVRRKGSQSLMSLRTAARLAGSLPSAAAPTLRKLGWTDLAEQAGAIDWPAKADELIALLLRHARQGEKVLVFTAFRQTLDRLVPRVADAGLRAAVYHGSLSRAAKEATIAAFRDDPQTPVLLSTESAGEGRNLQFCHVMVNVDLPWNPMQIEQRLGRLHRVGQTRDVLLTNLVSRGTIEQRILHVLEAKINMFELVVGELDMILGRVDEEFDFEASVFDAFAASRDDAQFEARMDEIGERMAAARGAYLRTRDSLDNIADGAERE